MEFTITITAAGIATATVSMAILLWIGFKKGGFPGMMHR